MLGTPAAPTLETPRLILRGWRPEDLDPYAAMLADPETARFITRKGQPLCEREVWSEMAFLIGHWQMLGYGMFVVEERATGAFLGRIGPLAPAGWPGFEIAWGLARPACGKGYAQEAARAAIDWSFETLRARPDHFDHPPRQRRQPARRRTRRRAPHRRAVHALPRGLRHLGASTRGLAST